MTNFRRVVFAAAAVAVFALAGAAPAQAQIQRVESGKNAIGFNVGFFAVRGIDSRVDDDVLVADLSQGQYSLAFDVADFNGVTFGGEYVAGIGDYLEAGFGVGLYQNTVHSVYAQKVRDDGSELEQDLKLRIVPLTATVRFLPIGRRGFTPYVGAGIGAFNWHYSEVGEFIFSGDVTDNDRFVADGWAAGPVVLGGVRVPVSDALTVGGELRWQHAVGKGLIEQNELFLGDKIDLSGWTTNFTVHIKF
jgi:opacity protein-like surface antigen